jgi:hypothetical protein
MFCLGLQEDLRVEDPDVVVICDNSAGSNATTITALKNDRTMKAQFYRVVETEYPQYVCYPGGKLPIPVAVSYPQRTG